MFQADYGASGTHTGGVSEGPVARADATKKREGRLPPGSDPLVFQPAVPAAARAGPAVLTVEGSNDQSSMGAMIWAKLFRARFRRLFTVPRLHLVMSAISS